MKCSVHPAKDAVGQCPECGAALCYDCYNYTIGHYCPDCVSNFYYQEKKYRRNALIFGIIFAIIFGIFLGIIMGSTGQSAGMVVFLVVYGLMGGFAFGSALFVNRDTRKTALIVVVLAVISLVLGPIFFFIHLVGYLRLSKRIKEKKQLLENWPK